MLIHKIRRKSTDILKRAGFGELVIKSALRHRTVQEHNRNYDALEADKALLGQFSPDPLGTSVAVNRISDNPGYDLQIIVPVYKVERYLRECIDSILGQKTSFSFSVVLVDDGSPDKCPGICEEYAAADSRVKLIHKQNGGLSSARNAALAEIDAEYVMFVDSDDRLPENSIERLMTAAKESGADIVQGSYEVFDNGRTSRIGYASAGMISYDRLMGFAWGKVYKSRLFEKLRYPEGYWFEDTLGILIVFPAAKGCLALPDTVYEYRRNPSGIVSSAKFKPKNLDSLWITILLVKERESLNLANDNTYLKALLMQFKINQDRFEGLPEEISKAAFRMSAETFNRIFPSPDTSTLPPACRLMSRALRNYNFIDFVKACTWW